MPSLKHPSPTFWAAVVLALAVAHLLEAQGSDQPGEPTIAEKPLRVDDWPNEFDATGMIELKDAVSAAAFSSDGRRLVTIPHGAAEMVFRNPATAEVLERVSLTGLPVVGLKFTRDGKFLLMRGDNSAGDRNRQVGVAIWDVAAKQFKWRMNTTFGESGSAFCPADDSENGRYLVAGDESGKVRLWDFSAGAVTQTFSIPGGTVIELVISPDGKRLLASGRESELTLWDTATGRLLATHSDPRHVPRWFGFMPDGAAVVSTTTDTGVNHVDMSTRRSWMPDANPKDAMLREFVLAAQARQPSVEWPKRDVLVSPDRKRMMVPAGGPCWAMLLLTTDDPEMPAPIAGDQFDMIQAGFTPDNRSAYVVITEDMTKRRNDRTCSLAFWDAATAKPGRRMEPPGGVLFVAWSPDGQRVLVAGPERAWLWPSAAQPD